MGIKTKRIVLNGWPHGFGADGGWVKDYAMWLEDVFNSSCYEQAANRTTNILIYYSI